MRRNKMIIEDAYLPDYFVDKVVIKGWAKNNLLEFAPGFRSDSLDPKAQSHRNSEPF